MSDIWKAYHEGKAAALSNLPHKIPKELASYNDKIMWSEGYNSMKSQMTAQTNIQEKIWDVSDERQQQIFQELLNRIEALENTI